MSHSLCLLMKSLQQNPAETFCLHGLIAAQSFQWTCQRHSEKDTYYVMFVKLEMSATFSFDMSDSGAHQNNCFQNKAIYLMADIQMVLFQCKIISLINHISFSRTYIYMSIGGKVFIIGNMILDIISFDQGQRE